MATSWFLYDGSGSTTDPLNYNQVSGTPACFAGVTICAIFAETQMVGSPPAPRPIITATLSNEITTADNTNTPSTNVKLRNWQIKTTANEAEQVAVTLPLLVFLAHVTAYSAAFHRIVPPEPAIFHEGTYVPLVSPGGQFISALTGIHNLKTLYFIIDGFPAIVKTKKIKLR